MKGWQTCCRRALGSIRMFQSRNGISAISGYTPGEIRVLMGLKHHIEPDGPGMKVSKSAHDECYVSDDHQLTLSRQRSGGAGDGCTDRRAVRVQLTEEGHALSRNLSERQEQRAGGFSGEGQRQTDGAVNEGVSFHEQNAKRMKRYQTTRGGGFVKTVSLHETVPDRGHFVLLFTFFQCLSDLYLLTDGRIS